jgi:hypothetical protein
MQTVQILHSVINSASAPEPSGDSSSDDLQESLLDDVADVLAKFDPISGDQHTGTDEEFSSDYRQVDFDGEFEKHKLRLEQLELEMEGRLNNALLYAVEQFRNECRSSFDQVQELMNRLSETERHLAKIAAQHATPSPAKQESASIHCVDPNSTSPSESDKCAEAERDRHDSVTTGRSTLTHSASDSPDLSVGDERNETSQTDPMCQRGANRLRVDPIPCNLGEIVDLSRTGARIVCELLPDADARLQVSHDDLELDVAVEVIWSRLAGWRKREVGLRFLNLAEKDVAMLTRICMDNRDRRALAS